MLTKLARAWSLVGVDAVGATGTGVEGAIVGSAETAAIGIGAAILVPTAAKIWQHLRNAAARDPELADTPAKKVESVFDVLGDSRLQQANNALDDALADLIREPDWEEVRRRLDLEIQEWAKSNPAGAGNLPDREVMVRVILSSIRNLREATYRALFAEHFRHPDSVDRAHHAEIANVFVRLQALDQPSVSDPQAGLSDEQKHLDFRHLDAEGIEQKLRHVGNVVIIGEPGSGKSTMLRYLSAMCAASETDAPFLPVLLNLSEYARGQQMLIAESAVTAAADALQIDIPAEFFAAALHEGRCLIGLDGLDEVPKEERRRVVRNIAQLSRTHHGDNRIIVTSRRAGYDDEPLDQGLFQRYAVQPMDDADIWDLIDWRFGVGSQSAQSVRETIEQSADLKPLVSNPLQLAMFNMVYHEDAQDELPLKPAGFYQRVVDELIPDPRTARVSEYGGYKFYAHLEHLTAAVAHDLHLRAREYIGENDLSRTVAGILQSYERLEMGQDESRIEAAAFVEMVEQRIGLLVGQRVRRSTEFRFLHSAFREYLAARYIYLSHFTDGPEALWEDIEPHLSDVHWEEVIVFLLSGFEDDEQEHCTYLAEKILAAAEENRQGHEDPDDEDYYEASILSNYYEHLVIDALTGQAPLSLELQDRVISMLRGWAGRNRYDALDYLSNIRHIPEKVIPELAEIATGSVFADFHRVLAARKIGGLGARENAIKLLTGLAQDQALEGQARVFAGRYLGDLGEVETATGVLSGIGNNPAEGTYARGLAFGGLRELGQAEVAREWLARIAEDQTARVNDRLMAWRELAKFGENERQRSLDRVSGIAADPNVPPQTRITAAYSLYSLGNREEAVRITAALAIDPAISDELEDWWLRASPDLAIDALTAIARDPSAPDRDREWAVGAFEDTYDIRPVVQIAADASVDNFIRVVAAGIIREGSLVESARAAMDPLNEVARDHNARPRHRYLAGSTLAALGETETAINALAAVAEDADADGFVRTNAADELATLGDRETALRALQSTSQDEDAHPIARLRASDALVRHGAADAAITALTAVAQDPAVDEWDRGSAVAQLSAVVEHAAAQEALRSIEGDGSMPELVRTLAHNALEQSKQE